MRKAYLSQVWQITDSDTDDFHFHLNLSDSIFYSALINSGHINKDNNWKSGIKEVIHTLLIKMVRSVDIHINNNIYWASMKSYHWLAYT